MKSSPIQTKKELKMASEEKKLRAKKEKVMKTKTTPKKMTPSYGKVNPKLKTKGNC